MGINIHSLTCFIYSCILFAHLAVQHTITLNVMKSQWFFGACSHKVKGASCLGLLDVFHLFPCWFCVVNEGFLGTIVHGIVLLLWLMVTVERSLNPSNKQATV